MRTPALALVLAALLAPASALAVDDSWTLIGEKDGIKSYKKSLPGTKFFGFAGDGVIDADIAHAVSVALDVRRFTEYVDLLAEAELLEQGPRDVTVWQRYDLSWPVIDRDYALRGHVEPNAEAKTVTVTWKSIDDPRIPERDCCVRAEVTRTFFRFTALPDGKTRIECEIITDPKGVLPAWMANIVQKSWPYNTIKGYARQARKPDVAPRPEYAGWR